MKNVVSFSGGKDSTAMLINMIEMGYKIDDIVFADTGFEYPEMYNYIDFISEYIDRDITILKPITTWDHWFFGAISRGKRKGAMRGFPLQAYPCWWCREAKFKPLDKYMKNDIRFIGIVFDEKHRVTNKLNYKYPLVDWKWTEQDCYNYLKEKNIFPPLYNKFKRTGCWLCPKQSVGSLKILKTDYPDLFKKLLFYDWIDLKGFR